MLSQYSLNTCGAKQIRMMPMIAALRLARVGGNEVLTSHTE
jgi:hypothetical protein